MITRVFLLTGFCLIFICSQTVNASLQGKWFFDCKNGQQIPAEMKCDAHRDCTDGSDETFVECHKVVCPELACFYGGCYKESQQCDGNEDCWDHTDEHPEYCSPNTTKTPAIDIELFPGCGKNQFKCVTSSECLPIKHVCNGIMDCSDGSDETNQICLILECTDGTFRWDISNVLPPNCFEWATYDDPPIHIAPDTQKDKASIGSCKVPENLQNLQVMTWFNVPPYHKAVPIENSTMVRVSCLNNTELSGPDLNLCLDGKWQYNWPECRETSRDNTDEPPAIPAPEKDETNISKGCKVPKKLHNLQVRTLFNVLPYHVGVPLAHSTVVRLSCPKNTELYGPDLNQCLDGRWQAGWPECRKTYRDHIDEHPEYWSPNIPNTPTVGSGSWPQCGKNQFKCVNSSECLAIERVCDGILDCQDGTDEISLNCHLSQCPKEAFRCAYGGCLAQAKVCDHVLHCWDKSDEFPSICSENKTLPWELYHDPPEHIRTQNKNKASILEGCKVPENLPNLRITTVFTILPYQVTVTQEARLSCLDNTELYGQDVNRCLDGKWQNSWPECRETCRPNFSRDISIQAICQNKIYGPTTNCNQKDSKLFVGTNAYISCASGYVPKGNVESPMVLKCKERSDPKNRPYWSAVAKTNPLQCVPECGKIHSDEYPDPWIVSLFTSDIYHRKFRFQGYGYIISPWAILVSLSNITTHDVLRYVVAEGDHQVEYTENDEEAHLLHSVKHIFISKKYAVLELMRPFILSPSVRPICLPPIPRNVPYSSYESIVTIRQNGQETSYLKNINEHIIKLNNIIILNNK